jgi:hypothetical protein
MANLSTETVTAGEVVLRMQSRFTSGNNVPVERAHITQAEWAAIVGDVLKLNSRNLTYDCPRCHKSVSFGDSICERTKKPHVQRCGEPYVIHCNLPNGHEGPHMPLNELLSWGRADG